MISEMEYDQLSEFFYFVNMAYRNKLENGYEVIKRIKFGNMRNHLGLLFSTRQDDT